MSPAAAADLAVLVTDEAWAAFSGVLRPAAPQAQWWLLARDGSVTAADAPGSPMPLADLDGVTVTWLSNDLFYSPSFGPMADYLKVAPLDWVHCGASGTDVPLFQAIIQRGVRFSTSHVTAIPIAEYVIGSVLRHYQQPHLWAAAAAAGEWKHHDFREVFGTTWLVYGLGSIGAAVSVRARAMGASVIGVRRTPHGAEPVDEMLAPAQVPDHLSRADVVVLSAPAGPETAHLVDDEFLAAMAPDSVLVNVARGALVDEVALEAALDAGRPAHAIVDVAATEPPPADSFLWNHPKVTLTPHASAGGTGRYLRSAQLFASNLVKYQDGDTVDHEVQP